MRSVLIIVVCCWLRVVECFPTGVPNTYKGCANAIPNHSPNMLRNDAMPYNISINLKSSGNIEVSVSTLDDTEFEDYKGILLTVRNRNSRSVLGTFVNFNTEEYRVACRSRGNSGLTHKSAIRKTSSVFEWAPGSSEFIHTDLMLWVTIVNKYDVFWREKFDLNDCENCEASSNDMMETSSSAMEGVNVTKTWSISTTGITNEESKQTTKLDITTPSQTQSITEVSSTMKPLPEMSTNSEENISTPQVMRTERKTTETPATTESTKRTPATPTIAMTPSTTTTPTTSMTPTTRTTSMTPTTPKTPRFRRVRPASSTSKTVTETTTSAEQFGEVTTEIWFPVVNLKYRLRPSITLSGRKFYYFCQANEGNKSFIFAILPSTNCRGFVQSVNGVIVGEQSCPEGTTFRLERCVCGHTRELYCPRNLI